MDNITENKISATKSLVLLGIDFSFEFIKTTLIVIVIALLFRYFLIQPFVVVGQSMEPNFHDKEYLVVDKLSYKIRHPKRGEVVIFHPPQNLRESYIKRVIGLPGELVEIKDGQVYIDGRLLKENYIKDEVGVKTKIGSTRQLLNGNEYFVFGDNRDHSSDSREIGPIPINHFQGRVALVLFPIRSANIPKTPLYTNQNLKRMTYQGAILSYQ